MLQTTDEVYLSGILFCVHGISWKRKYPTNSFLRRCNVAIEMMQVDEIRHQVRPGGPVAYSGAASMPWHRPF